jgi:uncharacterized protein (TIGR02246 family)
MVARAPEELHTLVEAALNAGDVDGFVDLYDDDATLIVPPDGIRASGKEAIRMAIEATLALKPAARMEVLEKLEANGLALTRGRWTLVAADGDGGRVELSGLGTMVSRCQPDGTWRIVLDNPMSFDSSPAATST